MRIALCDRDDYYIEKIKACLYRYSNLYKFEFSVDTFTSSNALLNSDNSYYLVFIEYSLSGFKGLETAKKLKLKNSNTTIIFMTEQTNIILDAFNIAYSILTKPISENSLFETLDDYFSLNGIICLCNRGDTYCFDINNIIYLEASNKHCLVHLENTVIEYNKTMARVFAKLPKSKFIKINRAFIINLNYIFKYNREWVYLTNGENLHITRKYYKAFKEEYLHRINPYIP